MSDAPALSLDTHAEDGMQVMHAAGEVNLETAPQFHSALLAVIEKKPKRLIIDLGGVKYMDSSGVGTLVDMKRRVEKHGGKLVLAALQPAVRGVFEITQLTKFFQIAPTLEEARQQ